MSCSNLSFKDSDSKCNMLKVFDNLGWKYTSSCKSISYAPDNKGELKKAKDTFWITGKKNKEPFDYPRFDKVENPETIILYAGKLSNFIGIDIDDYEKISVVDKLVKYGYSKKFAETYKFITITGKNGIHIEHEYNIDLDINTTNIPYKLRNTFYTRKGDENGNNKSCIDIRGSGGLLIGAGSKSNIGDYNWVNGIPTKDDKLLPLAECHKPFNNAIIDYKLGNLAVKSKHNVNGKVEKFNKRYKEIEKIQNDSLKKRGLKEYVKKEKTTYDVDIYSRILNKLQNYSEDYTDWCVIGMIIGNEFDFSETGLTLFKDFSAYSDKYDEEHTINQFNYWMRYDTPTKYPALNSTTLFYYLVRQCGSNAYNDIQKEIKEDKVETETTDSNVDDLDIYSAEVYKSTKKLFEETNFKVKNIYVKIHETFDDGYIYEEYKKNDFIDEYIDYANIFIKKKCFKFIDMWIKDSDKRKYHDYIFKPSIDEPFIEKNGLTFVNAFRGFQGGNKSIDDISSKEKQFIIDTWKEKLLMLCENNPVLYDYCFHFIRKMFLYPEQKSMNVMVCFVSNFTGLGKSTFVDFLGRMVGEEYYKTTADITKIFGGFSELRYKTILLGYEEGDIKSTAPLFNRFKNLITDPKDIVEPKFQKSRQVLNCNHLFMTTNYTKCLKIEDTDRRTFVVKGKTPSDMDKFVIHQKNWEKLINTDTPTGKISPYVVYDYIKNFKCGCEMCDRYFNFGYNIPQTEARQTIQEAFIPVEIVYLKYLIESDFKDFTYGMYPKAEELKLLYRYSFNRQGFMYDKKCGGGEYKDIDDGNKEEFYKGFYDTMLFIYQTRNFIETKEPLNSYLTKQKLRKETETAKNIKLIKEYSKILQFDYELIGYEWYNNDEDRLPFLKIKRDIENKYVKLDISYFVWSLNKWRTKNNHPSTSKSATAIRDTLREVFGYDTEEPSIEIKKQDGKYKLIFNKTDLLSAINNKYKFNRFESEE